MKGVRGNGAVSMTPQGAGGKHRQRLVKHFTLGLACISAISAFGTISRADLPGRYELADLKALEQAFVELAAQVRPAVVAIRTYKSRESAEASSRSVMRPLSQGSGFIIGEDGYIATNRHVVEGADVVSVILHDGTQHDANVVQTDVRMDLAVIKVEAAQLPPVRFGDHSKVRVNQWVFACGNPFGLANQDGQASITFGVISALGRYMTDRLGADRDIEYYGNMIETSAAINPGSSGGPLFNLDGEVIGVVTAIETTSGVNEGHGFAIPMDRHIRRVIETLRNNEQVRYGFLGVSVRDVDPATSKLAVDGRTYRGAQLDEVNGESSPAAQAGLAPGDVVVEYDGSPVQDSDHLVRLVGFTPVGSRVKVVYLRRGVKREADVTVGDRFELLGRANPRQR